MNYNIKIPYNIRKGLFNCAYIFSGVLLVKLAPYSDQLTSGTVPPDLMVWNFWKHVFISGAVVTFTAEIKYLYRWLATMGGTNGDNRNETKQNPLQLR